MRRALICLALLAGCGGPHWSVPLAALDRVPLSVTQSDGSATWIAGGALGSGGDALLARYTGGKWSTLAVSTDATLWWVFAPAGDRVWAVGERGTVVHWDGATLARETVPTTETLYGIWGAADDDLWAVGGMPDTNGVILHRDGSGWHDLTPPNSGTTFFKVWGSRSSDVFICGEQGVILHWDGSALVAQPTGLPRLVRLLTVAGRAADDVYAVGGPANAVALHYDGQAWSALPDALLHDLPGLAGVSIDASGDHAVYMVGFGGTLVHGRPGQLHDESGHVTTVDLHAVSVRDGQVFAVGGNYQAPAGVARMGVVAHYGGDVASSFPK